MNLVQNVLDRFKKKKPMTVMTRLLVANCVSEATLDSIFGNHAQRQKEGELTFSTVADMMGDVVLKMYPSINASHAARELTISVQSVYNKLKGIETNVSRAVVNQTAARMMDVIDQLGAGNEPLLRGYRCKIVDGNHLRHTDSRIGELRECNVAPLPGKSLVVYDPQYRLAVDVFPCECGHASERTLLPELLDTIEAKDLLIADRNFSTVAFLFGIGDRHAKFVIRQHGQMAFTTKGRQRRVGESETGIIYEQNIQCVGESGEIRNFRRITVHLYEPTRDHDTEVHVITNLPQRVSAEKVADLYRKRWKIETAFQNMAENLQGEITTLGYPCAALFGFCMALVSYNVFSTIRAAIQAVHGKEAGDNLSIYYVTNEITAAYEGMSVVLDHDFFADRYAHLTPRQVAAELKRIAAGVNLKKYRKNKQRPKNNSRPKKIKTNRQHASTKKILVQSRGET